MDIVIKLVSVGALAFVGCVNTGPTIVSVIVNSLSVLVLSLSMCSHGDKPNSVRLLYSTVIKPNSFGPW